MSETAERAEARARARVAHRHHGPVPAAGPGVDPYARWAIGVILAVMTLQILFLLVGCDWDFCGDEAEYWSWSRRLDWSYWSRGPLIAWLIRLGHRGLRRPEPSADGLADVRGAAAGRVAGRADRLGGLPPGRADDGLAPRGDVRDPALAGDPGLRDRGRGDHLRHAAGLLLDLGGGVDAPRDPDGQPPRLGPRRRDRGAGRHGEILGPGPAGVGRPVPAPEPATPPPLASPGVLDDERPVRRAGHGADRVLECPPGLGRSGPARRSRGALGPRELGEPLARARVPRRRGRRPGRDLVDRRPRRAQGHAARPAPARRRSEPRHGRHPIRRPPEPGSRRGALPALPLGRDLVRLLRGQPAG